jgi:hypothetical protein
MLKNLKGWTAGLFAGSLGPMLLQALGGGLPGLLVYGPITLILMISGLTLLGSSRISKREGAAVYIGLVVVLLFVGAFLKAWVASLMAA